MLADENLTSRFRVVVFDLPWHGKSLPPAEWWKNEYLLTTDAYASLVEDFCAALELETPIVVGCSMAGSLAIELARRSPDRWRAVVGLSGAMKVEGRFHDWPLRPDLNAQQIVPTWTHSLMSPHSPEESRREVWWIYSQGGPGISKIPLILYLPRPDAPGVPDRYRELKLVRAWSGSNSLLYQSLWLRRESVALRCATPECRVSLVARRDCWGAFPDLATAAVGASA
jgi:pimeloyl-ACP methyl ester carboxylesterase